MVLNVRWYVTYKLSYRDLVSMMGERGIDLAHTTILRWYNITPRNSISAGTALHEWWAAPGGWMKRMVRRAARNSGGFKSIRCFYEKARLCQVQSSKTRYVLPVPLVE